MKLPIDYALPHDLSGVVDRFGKKQKPRRIAGEQIIQIRQLSVAVEERTDVPVAVEPETSNLVVDVDRTAAWSDGRDRAGKRADVFHPCCFRPKEGMNRAVGKLRRARDVTAIIDASPNVRRRASQVSQIDGPAIVFPKHGMRTIRASRGESSF